IHKECMLMKWKKAASTALAAAMILGLLPQSISAQDRSVDRFLIGDQRNNYGRGLSETTTGGFLAWGSSYSLESYMSMYEATQDKFYLDKIVEQTDRILASANDHNSDGYLGWSDARYAHNQLKNGAFAVKGALEGSSSILTNGS